MKRPRNLYLVTSPTAPDEPWYRAPRVYCHRDEAAQQAVELNHMKFGKCTDWRVEVYKRVKK